MESEYLPVLIDHLLRKTEQRCVEFKNGNVDPQRIGKYVSALGNAAALEEEPYAYMMWGIEDGTRKVLGTDFEPSAAKHGNESLEFWLSKAVQPMPSVDFHVYNHPDGRIVLMRVQAASLAPIRFNGRPYIRIGDATPELSNHPELESKLWGVLRSYRWEEAVALQFQTGEQVIDRLDFSAYFRLIHRPIPETRDDILEVLAADRLIEQGIGDRWNILNLGAILFANELSGFAHLARKAVRIIRYIGDDRRETFREREGEFGYAKAFEAMITVVDALLPKKERIGRALREEVSAFSQLSIRELIANALIHQDMTITGAGPMVEIFENRIEITNPGKPLIEIDRFIDSPPRSRNEAMAALMRRMNICEERGSGIDKVVFEAEENQLPPPNFAALDGSVRVTIYGPRSFADMTPSERTRACYQHTCLKVLAGARATNASLRERFGIDQGNAAQVSRVFRLAFDDGFIKFADPAAPRAGYIPWWA